MQAYNKAIAAVVVPAILALLSFAGITEDMLVSEAVEATVAVILTALAVYLVPNRP